MNAFGIAVATVLLVLCLLLYVPFRWRPFGIFLFMEKAVAVGYVPFIAVAAIALTAGGLLTRSWWITAPAAVSAAGAIVVMVRVGSARVDLAGALGADWDQRIAAGRRARMVRRWWSGPLRGAPEPRLRQDVCLARIPGGERALLGDVWQPPADVPVSGVALIYLHGSGYYVLDKDLGTRPLFRHLTAQGHVVVDVAYRLFPETDVSGMVADAKRAIAWVRGHAEELAVDPHRIVLAGGSSGGHLALLAAYTGNEGLSAPDLQAIDVGVCGVASLYGQVGVDTLYWHTSQDKVCHPDDPQPDWTALPSRTLVRLFGRNAARLRLQFMPYGGRCDWLVGGTPDQVPTRYAEVSALTYLKPGCPPTLLMHGTHDEMAPVSAVRGLERKLTAAGVPVTAVYLPHTDHAFDVIGARWSPSARVAFYALERFLVGVRPVMPRLNRREDQEASTTMDALPAPV